MSWVVIYVSTPTLLRPTQLAVATFQKHFHGSQAVLFLVYMPRQSMLCLEKTSPPGLCEEDKHGHGGGHPPGDNCLSLPGLCLRSTESNVSHRNTEQGMILSWSHEVG